MTVECLEVRVKPHGCQTTKAELKEPFVIRKLDGTMPTPEELARAALRRAKVVEDSDASTAELGHLQAITLSCLQT